MLSLLILTIAATIAPPPSDGLPPPKVAKSVVRSSVPCLCHEGAPVCRCGTRCPCASKVAATHQKSPQVIVTRRGYPTRGSLWSHPGNIKSHLKSGEHAGKFDPGWIDSLSYMEAEAVHSDDHEGRLKWAYVVRPGQYAMASPRVRHPAMQQRRTMVRGNCPGGWCPR